MLFSSIQLPLCDLLFGHALGRAGLAWESAAKCVPHGGSQATIAQNPCIQCGSEYPSFVTLQHLKVQSQGKK